MTGGLYPGEGFALRCFGPGDLCLGGPSVRGRTYISIVYRYEIFNVE